MTTTATAQGPEAVAAVAAGPRPYRITLPQYDRMIAAGVFHASDPVFLWEGRLVQKMPKGPDHSSAHSALLASMFRLVPDGWHVRVESPVRVLDSSVPEPDFTVLRGANRDFKDRTPTARDVSLVAEVADSSLPFDSGKKLEAYAAESIPVYWVVNIPGQTVDVYTRPTGPAEPPRYEDRRSFGPDEEVPVVLDGREVGRVAVRDVLP